MRKMSDDLRIKEVESLLDRYYKSEDSFEQTELAISIIQGHVGHLLNSLKQNKRYKQALEYIQREIRKAIYTPKKQKWNSDFEREFESGKTRGLIQASDIVKEAIEILEGEE